ncbi:hypothetical protein DmGdi_30430 [Gluconobacter sp. Gdi]|nr:hypothetical protein DmGdi_30430 [Gluconobacter sp. Gdi]
MSHSKPQPSLSPTAIAQWGMMTPKDSKALRAFFADKAELTGPNTKRLETGVYVSRVRGKRVLWQRQPDDSLIILTIVDESYASSGLKAVPVG